MKRISFGSRRRGTENVLDSSEVLQQCSNGAALHVYCSHSNAWEDPFKFIQIDGSMLVVHRSRGRKVFHSSCITTFTKPGEDFLKTTNIWEE